RVRYGETEGEDAAFFGLAKDRDVAAVCFDHHLAEGEPQARAARSQARLRMFPLHELVEDVFLFFGWDSFAVIPNLDGQPVSIVVKRDGNLAGYGRGVSQGVRHKAPQHATQKRGVPADRRQIPGEREGQLFLSRLGERLEIGNDALGTVRRVE